MKKVALILLTIYILMLSACSSQPSTWTVEFDTDGGNVINSIVVKDGQTITEPEKPVKDEQNGTEYIFVAWTLNGVPFNFSTPITKNITLKAQYKSINTCIVFFGTDGGTMIEQIEVKSGLTISQPENPSKFEQNVDYEFLYWSLNGQLFDFSTPIISDITLKAEYKKTEYCIVTFDTDGGSVISKARVEKGKTLIKPKNPTKTDNSGAEYVFVKWTLDGKEFDFSTPIISDITLKAEYEKINTCIVTFDSDGGTFIQSKIVDKGQKVSKPKDPVKESTQYLDFEFLYWTLNGEKFDFNTPIAEDITLVAKYAIYPTIIGD